MNAAQRKFDQEHAVISLAGWIKVVRAMNPGQQIVVIHDAYGVDVRAQPQAFVGGMSEEEYASLLAGDIVRLENGTTVELAR